MKLESNRITSGIIAFLAVLTALEPAVLYAQPTATGQPSEQLRALLEDTQKVDRMVDGLRSLGEYYTQLKSEVGIEGAKQELKEQVSNATQEQIRRINNDSSLSNEKKHGLTTKLKEQLFADLADIDVTDNLYQYFDTKARRLLDRDFDLIPFQPDDSIGMSILEVFLWVCLIGVVALVIVIIIAAIVAPGPSDPCYHCHYDRWGHRTYCHSRCGCRAP